MISKNITSNCSVKEENVKPVPFLLTPSGKDYLWGGNRLNDEFAKNIDMEPLAETWECSTHPDGPCYVQNGEFAGMTLEQVIKENPQFLGTHPQTKDELPILIKFIDAEKNLSVQVHPDDQYAFEHENGQLGKSEMWYVLDAAKDAHLIYGLYHDTEKKALRTAIENGTLDKYLQKVNIHQGDVFYIEAGTIHAIGAGALIAEIQENSNLTYRLYDYNRIDKNGEKRTLHVDKALDVADLKGKTEPAQPMRVLKYRKGCAEELLCRCKYFEVYRMLVNTERYRKLVDYKADLLSFRVLLCIGGCGTIVLKDKRSFNFFKGDCVFFPADSQKVKIHGTAQFLDVRG